MILYPRPSALYSWPRIIHTAPDGPAGDGKAQLGAKPKQRIQEYPEGRRGTEKNHFSWASPSCLEDQYTYRRPGQSLTRLLSLKLIYQRSIIFHIMKQTHFQNISVRWHHRIRKTWNKQEVENDLHGENAELCQRRVWSADTDPRVLASG